MSIAVDTSVDGGFSVAGDLTFSHTCTGSDLLLVVVCFGDTNSDSISGATYNGVAMTLVGKVLASAATRYVYIFFLLGPATGAHDVVVSTTGTQVGAVSGSYTGVKQTAQPDDDATNSATSTSSVAGTVTTVADNCWLIMGGLAVGAAAGTGATLRQDWATSSAMKLFDSNGAITPAGMNSMTMNCTAGNDAAVVIASFAPAVAAGSVKTVTGVAFASVKTVDGVAIASVKTIQGVATT